jgi:hypothetical protein
MKRVALWVLAGSCAWPAAAFAQAFPEHDVPPTLRGWVPWVRDEVPESVCPKVGDGVVCLWPARLALRVSASGGAFVLDAFADRPLEARLPGDTRHWPEDVTLDGHPAPVSGAPDVPSVHLAVGAHRLEGRFSWARLPDSLPVPQGLALVDLEVEGRSLPTIRRDEAGILWLREGGEARATGEALQVQVFRKVTDGIPLFVETHLSLEVSGKGREVELAGALLPGAVAVATGGDLPARFDASGKLRVQVRPGSFSVTVTERLEGRPASLSPPDKTPGWPDHEVWVFEANEAIRQVTLSGLNPIDPSRTELPPDWRRLPAFLVEKGSRLAFHELRRGEPEGVPDHLSLRRELWLDLSGSGFSVRDSLTGTLSRTWRLNLDRPAALGRASLDGAEQLITAAPGSELPGLEVRRGALKLEADSRLPRSGRLSAVGWSTDVDHLEASVALPPGWTLLAASGVDTAAGTWTARWTLLGFFFVLIVALSAGRLYGRFWGLVGLLATVLTFGENGAPLELWLVILVATALARVAPAPWLARIGSLVRSGGLVVLLLVLIPFVRDQVMDCLHPQVGHRGRAGAVLSPLPGFAAQGVPRQEEVEALKRLDLAEAPPPQEPASAAAPEAKVVRRALAIPDLSSESAGKTRAHAYQNAVLEQDPKAVVQTGPGIPTWSWQRYTLGWSGPVRADQTVRLFLLSPAWNRVLIVLRLLVVFLLALRLALSGEGARPWGSPGAAAVVTLLLLFAAPGLRAQDSQEPEAAPDSKLLEELKARLTRPEACQPHCIATARLKITARPGEIGFEAEVHAQDKGAWGVPGPPSSWAPSRILVDGSAASVARLANGFLYVRLLPGVHKVVAAGPVPDAGALTVQLPDVPHEAQADAPGFEVTGLRPEGPPEPSIHIVKRLAEGEKVRQEEGHYAPWLEITRTLRVGLTWGVETRVRRVSPPGSPISLRVGLVPGEQPLDADLETKDGVALVSLGRDQVETQWTSHLPPTESLTLKAPTGALFSEVWRLECGAVWQCRSEGLDPVARMSDGLLVPDFRPWPGESLTVRFLRPLAVPGPSVTLDSVRVETTPGQRLTDTALTLTARASREEALTLDLPKGAEIQEVTLDGAPRPSRPANDRLSLTVPAGSHAAVVRWREGRGMGLYSAVSGVGLSVPAVNIEGWLHLGNDRWILLTSGPSWGPAILFWSYLAFALLVAFGLGLFTSGPLTIPEWLLLALGLTQVPAPEALIVVAALLALSLRARKPPKGPLFNLVQGGLAVLVLLSLFCLYEVVETGLILRPDMQVAGGRSSNTLLRWYTDRMDPGPTPGAAVLSLPLWAYRWLMLGWALWLASRLLRWAPWAWRAFSSGGAWRSARKTGTPPRAGANGAGTPPGSEPSAT